MKQQRISQRPDRANAGLRIVGFARVSSREQALEGNSLDVQEAAIRTYVEQHNAHLVQMIRVAESAKDSEARSRFMELLAFVEDRANRIDKIVFCQVDRAIRSIEDLAKLERLQRKHGVSSVSIRENMDNSAPEQELALTMLAAVAKHQVQAQARKIQNSVFSRVADAGLFPGRAPWGYKNVRLEGRRGEIVPHPTNAAHVRRIFELFADLSIAVPALGERLLAEGIFFSERCPRFQRSKLYAILNDRSYLGEVRFHGKWWPGRFPPLVDRVLFERVEKRLGKKGGRASRDLLFSGNLLRCGHCGHAITGELIKGKYRYYRCSQYNLPDHPRERVREQDLDTQVRCMLQSLRIDDDDVRQWFVDVLRAQSRSSQAEARSRRLRLQGELRKVQAMKDELVDLRLRREINDDTFRTKQQQLVVRERELQLSLGGEAEIQTETGEQAVRVFELSQDLSARWLTADTATKRLLLDIVCLNLRLDGQTLVPTLRKPFDLLAAGLLGPPAGDGRCRRD